MKFSVIMTLYNKENFVERSVRSILNQNEHDFELIIINDGSTDGSLEKIKAFNDKRLRIISINNSGVSIARNIGIKASKGDFIAFIDADDYWDNFYLTEIKYLIGNHPKEDIFCTCNCEIEKGKIKYKNPISNSSSRSSLIDYTKTFIKYGISPIHTSAIVIRRHAINDSKFHPGISMGEDLLFWIEITRSRNVVFSNKILSYYDRSDIKSLTRKISPWEKSFIPILASKFKSAQSLEEKKLITMLISNMGRPYYLFDNTTDMKNIIKTLDFSLFSLKNKLFYGLPISIIRIIYKKLKSV